MVRPLKHVSTPAIAGEITSSPGTVLADLDGTEAENLHDLATRTAIPARRCNFGTIKIPMDTLCAKVNKDFATSNLGTAAVSISLTTLASHESPEPARAASASTTSNNKVVFLVNKDKIVLHAYNSKQRFTVSGKNHCVFADKFLLPFFKEKVEACTEEATSINKNVISGFSSKVKRNKVKFKTVTCKKCSEVTKGIKQLHLHMKSKYEETLNLSTDVDVKQSTRNNSVEHLLLEDVTFDSEEEAELPLQEVKNIVNENVAVSKS